MGLAAAKVVGVTGAAAVVTGSTSGAMGNGSTVGNAAGGVMSMVSGDGVGEIEIDSVPLGAAVMSMVGSSDEGVGEGVITVTSSGRGVVVVVVVGRVEMDSVVGGGGVVVVVKSG